MDYFDYYFFYYLQFHSLFDLQILLNAFKDFKFYNYIANSIFNLIINQAIIYIIAASSFISLSAYYLFHYYLSYSLNNKYLKINILKYIITLILFITLFILIVIIILV